MIGKHIQVPAIMQQEVNDEPSNCYSKSTPIKSRDSSKRSRQVNQKEANEYLKRPINKVSNLNKDLKNSYSKKHLQDPKFNYIRKLKQIRKTGQDSVSEHGDTDDEDFDVNQVSSRGKNKKQVKTKTTVLSRTRKSSKQKLQNQTYLDQQSQIIAQQSEKDEKKRASDNNQVDSKEEQPSTLKNRLNKEIVSKKDTQGAQEQKNDDQSVNNSSSQSSKDSKQSEESQQNSKSGEQSKKQTNKQRKEQKKEEKIGTRKLQNDQKDSEKSSEDKMQQQKSSESNDSEAQDQQQNQDLADRIKNVLNNEDQPEQEVKLATFRKFNKKKGQKKTVSVPKSTRNKSIVKGKILIKDKEKENSKAKDRSSSAKITKGKGKRTNIIAKSINKQLKKPSPPKPKKQQTIIQHIRTRGKSKIQEKPIVIEEDKEQVVPRMTRKRKNKYTKETQLNLKGEVADMSNPPPFIEQKSKGKQERSKGEQSKAEQSIKSKNGQQKLDKFMVKVSETPIQSPKLVKNSSQNEATSPVLLKPNSTDQENRIKQLADKAINGFFDDRRKNLKIISRVIVESLLYYQSQRKKEAKHQKHKKQTVVDQSSDEDIREYVVPRKKNREKQKFKRYRKVVIEDSASEDSYQHASNKKHKREKHKKEGEQESQTKVERGRAKKRKHRHNKDSSQSRSVSRPNQEFITKEKKIKETAQQK